MSSDEWLRYHLPNVGTVEARLYTLARKCYELLQREGHVERLQNMYQLGVTREVFEGAHHSRWEYVMSQLTLIHQLNEARDKDENRILAGAGLTTRTGIADTEGDAASGADVLQCWALLLNAGHLDGTFATERALLRLCREPEGMKQAFLSYSGVNEKEARGWCKDVLENCRMYDMHKALMFFLLFRYRRKPEERERLVDSLIDSLKYYCIDNEGNSREKQTRLRALYNRVRQLCYLALDSLYTPVPLQLDFGNVLQNISDTGRALADATAPLCRELRSLDELLSREIYFSPDVVIKYSDHGDLVRRAVNRFYEEEHEDPTKDRHKPQISDLKALVIKLQDLSSFAPYRHLAGRQQPKRYRTVIDVPVRDTWPFFEANVDVEPLCEQLRRRCGSREVTVTALPDAKLSGGHVAVGIARSATGSAALRCFKGLIRTMCDLVAEHTNSDETMADEVKLLYHLNNSLSINGATEVVEKFLSETTTGGCQFRVARRGEFVSWLGDGTSAAGRALETIATTFLKQAANQHEILMHSKILRDVNATGATLSLVNSVAVTRDGVDVTNLDGLSITSKEGSPWLLIVEAKDQKRRSAADAADQLSSSITNMGLKDRLVDPTIHRRRQVAYLFSPIIDYGDG